MMPNSVIKSKKHNVMHNLEINDIDIDNLDARVVTLEAVPAFDNSGNVGNIDVLTTGQSVQLTMINNNITDIATNVTNINLRETIIDNDVKLALKEDITANDAKLVLKEGIIANDVKLALKEGIIANDAKLSYKI